MNSFKKLAKIKVDLFVIVLIAAIVLAYFFPFESSMLSSLPLTQIITIGISLIFFFYGVRLSPKKLKADLGNWKLHLVIHLSTFLLFPLIILAFHPLIGSGNQEMIWMGFFFLAVLPSTVSSSVVMVSLAKGNISASIFNSSISGLIGIILTPLWLSFFIDSSSSQFDFSGLYLNLLLEIALPVALGMFARRWLGAFVDKYSSQLSAFDKTVILIIIYNSFSHSFASNLFEKMKINELLLIFFGVIILFILVYSTLGGAAKLLHFNREDRIAAQFCGSKKSLVHGTVFYNLIFAGMSGYGIILIPIVLFHGIQILIVSSIARKKQKEIKVQKDKMVLMYPFQ